MVSLTVRHTTDRYIIGRHITDRHTIDRHMAVSLCRTVRVPPIFVIIPPSEISIRYSLRKFDHNLPERRKVGLKLLIAGRGTVELKNKGQNVEVGLVIKTARTVERHCAANLLQYLSDGFSFPPKLKDTFCQVRRFGVGSVEVGSVTTCTVRLISAFATFRLRGSKNTALNGSFPLLRIRNTSSEKPSSGKQYQRHNQDALFHTGRSFAGCPQVSTIPMGSISVNAIEHIHLSPHPRI